MVYRQIPQLFAVFYYTNFFSTKMGTSLSTFKGVEFLKKVVVFECWEQIADCYFKLFEMNITNVNYL